MTAQKSFQASGTVRIVKKRPRKSLDTRRWLDVIGRSAGGNPVECSDKSFEVIV